MVGSMDAGIELQFPSWTILAPLVPIVPSLMKDVHQQFRSYGGFTFAFRDYLEAGLQPMLDSDEFAGASPGPNLRPPPPGGGAAAAAVSTPVLPRRRAGDHGPGELR